MCALSITPASCALLSLSMCKLWRGCCGSVWCLRRPSSPSHSPSFLALHGLLGRKTLFLLNLLHRCIQGAIKIVGEFVVLAAVHRYRVYLYRLRLLPLNCRVRFVYILGVPKSIALKNHRPVETGSGWSPRAQ
ncbi:hypothetical protein BJX76DRAFT_10015 [Aspergillus varians]